MKVLFDLFPVIVFFGVYKFLGHGNDSCLVGTSAHQLPWMQEPILMATAAAIAATLVQVGWVKFRHGKVDAMLWMSFAIITLFGGATLYFRSPVFIQWKPTILYWTFAAVLGGAPLFTKRNPIRSMLESQLHLPSHVWNNLNAAYALFFLCLGFANLAAMHWLSCNGWVDFKVYGLTALLFAFVIAQSVMLAKYLETDKEHN
ncbi:MAG TPA: septation protein A [Gallionellaceae bacterium]|nr:septation protein A [Gallionellaceae bacterium]